MTDPLVRQPPTRSSHPLLAAGPAPLDSSWTLSAAFGDSEHTRCSTDGCRYLEPGCPYQVRGKS